MFSVDRMSYSHWSTSKFYTYWDGAKVYDKGDEIFACHTDMNRYYKFTYTECKILAEDLATTKGKINEINDDEEAIELQGYIKQFIGTIDTEYENI